MATGQNAIAGKACDLCKRPVGASYVDGRTRSGYWADMCLPCHRVQGVGLGLGKGQRYDTATRVKLEG